MGGQSQADGVAATVARCHENGGGGSPDVQLMLLGKFEPLCRLAIAIIKEAPTREFSGLPVPGNVLLITLQQGCLMHFCMRKASL